MAKDTTAHAAHAAHGHSHRGHTKVAGAWVSIKQTYIKVAGAWEPVKKVYEKLQGAWHEVGKLPATALKPVFNGAIADMVAVVGEAFTSDVSQRFSTGTTPTSYLLENAPTGMVISNAGVISWPLPTKVTATGILVKASTAGGETVSNAFGASAIALGPELVVNYGMDANTDNYVGARGAAIVWSADNGGEMHFSAPAGVNGEIRFKVSESLVAGETYILSADVVPDVPMKCQFYFTMWQQPAVAIAAGVRMTVRKTVTVRHTGNQTTNLVLIQTEAAVKTIVDNISVRKVLS